MRKSWLVARREYMENLRTRTFWIGVFAFPVILAVMLAGSRLLEGSKDVRLYGVVDHSGWLLDEVEERAAFPDLVKVLEEGRRRLKEGEDLEGWPEVVVVPIRMTLDQDDKAFSRFATALGKLYEPDPGRDARVARVLEQSGADADALVEAFREKVRTWWRGLDPEEADRYAPGLDRSRYKRISLSGPLEEQEERLARMLADGGIFAYFVIGSDPAEDGSGCKYVSKNLTDRDLLRWFSDLAREEVLLRRFAHHGIEREQAREILEPLAFERRMVDESGREERVSTTDTVRQGAPMAFVWLLWISIFSVSQLLLTNTIEEKSNRIIEVLLSSISPLQLMGGKIAGIALTGLTMIGCWLLTFFVGVKYGPSLMGADLGIDLSFIFKDPVYLGSFLAYFLMGYLLYASLLVGMGSVCNSLKEAQNLMQPVVLVLILPFIAMVPVSQDPNGNLARILSYVPPLTPFVMMNRAAGPPSQLDYVLTSLILLASVVLAVWAAGRIFRIGILMTGKPPRLREMLRWVLAREGGPASGQRVGP